MSNLTLEEMMNMQKELYEIHKDKWSPMEAKYGRNFMLWMIEEMGEAIAIIKKKGDEAIMEDTEVRSAFIEEMSDILMYYNEVLLRYQISSEDISDAYKSKHDKNMVRNYDKQYQDFLSKES